MKKIVKAALLLLFSMALLKAQTLSRFDFDDPAFDERIATIGPNAISSGSIANARATGNGTPQGCAAGVNPFGSGGCFTGVGCPQNINMVVPNTGNLFNVSNPTMSIDYRRAVREVDGWFWLKDQLAFGLRFNKITARYSYDNGVGGCVPQVEFAAYPPAWEWTTNGGWIWGGTGIANGEVPRDGVWRTYSFSYDPATGIASISINNPVHTEVNFGVAGMNFCGWSAANMVMGPNLDNGATGVTDPSAFLDNARYGTIVITPVLLEYFKAEQNGLGVDLHWKTTTEQNNMGYLLYRSHDGQDWVKFANVAGNATTNEPVAYDFRDETPYSGTSYYRLVQVDMNGATTGYPAIRVEMQYTGHELLGVYPNPVTQGKLNVKFESKADNDPISVNILDLRGQKVLHQDFLMTNGVNELELDVQGLSQGLYIAQVTNQGKVHSAKFSILGGQ